MNKIKSGFTLIEILIVIAIIGVLSVSLVPNIAGAPARARDLAKKQAVSQADAAMKALTIIEGKNINLTDAADGDPAGPVNICLNAAPVLWKNRAFDGAENLPSADTLEAENAGECIVGKKVYPKFFMDADRNYKFKIKVEANSSANDTAGTHYELGSDTLPDEA